MSNEPTPPDAEDAPALPRPSDERIRAAEMRRATKPVRTRSVSEAVESPSWKFIATMGTGFLALLMGGMLVAWMVFYHYSQDLPGFSKLATYEPPVVTRLYAGDGKLLAEYALQRRNYVPLVSIPKRVQQAFLAAEDKNFYTHPGIDFRGIMRAILTNVFRMGSPVGGSTITQQVVKNFLLTPEKTVERKIKEAILAFRITQSFSKSRILELYMNEIYLGAGSYGVAAAALNYFNKSVDELTIEEAAMLAAMPKAPSTYDPRKNMQAAKIRRDWVVGRMLEDGYIDAQEAKAAIETPITLRRRSSEETARADFFAEEVRRQLATRYGANVLYEGGLYVKTTLRPDYQHFADNGLRKALTMYDRRHGWRGAIRRIETREGWHEALAAMPRNGIHLLEGQQLAVVQKTTSTSAEIGLDDGSTGIIPLKEMAWARHQLGPLLLGPAVTSPSQVVSSGDVVMVERAEETPEEPAKTDKKEKAKAKPAPKVPEYSLRQEPQVNGAMVVMDAHTGKVLALTGGYAYGDTEFNRATQAHRQPGSSFKPFSYLAALEAGIKPNTIIVDGPIELPQGPGLPNWSPQNYSNDFLGPVPMRKGLEQSRNAITVRMISMIGIDRLIDVAERFGIYKKPPRQYSMVLGSQETTLMQMTTAYAALANGGLKVQPSLIERIDDRHGRVVWKRDARDCSACTAENSEKGPLPPPPPLPEIGERIVDAAVDYQLVHLMEGVVERGTATKAKILGRPLAGKTGTTNDSRDVWFMGYTPDLVVGTYIGFDTPRSLGKKETGGSTALPAFIDFMQHAMKDVPAQPFPVPEGIRFVALDKNTGAPIPGYPVIDPYAANIAESAANGMVPAPASGAVDDDAGVDEAPVSAAQENEPTPDNAAVAQPAPSVPKAAAPSISAAGRVGAPASPAAGIIMEAFRADALPFTAPPVAQPTLPWLQQDGAPVQSGPYNGQLPLGQTLDQAPAPQPVNRAPESPLNHGAIYRYGPDGTPYPVQPLGTTPQSAPLSIQQAPPSSAQPQVLGAPAVQWQQPAAQPPVRGWGDRSQQPPAPAPRGTGGLY